MELFQRVVAVTGIVLSLCCSSFTQQPTSLPDGVRLRVKLLDDLDLLHSEVGLQVRLLVTSNLRGPAGEIVVPKDAIALARVAERELVSKNKEARLYLSVEKVTWKRGSLPLHAFIIPPLVHTKILKLDLKNADPLFRPDIQLIGFGSHASEGTYLYCRKNFVLPEGTEFMVEQMSKPGPSAPPPLP